MISEEIFLSANIFFLKCFAMHPLDKDASSLKQHLFLFSKYFSIFFTYIMVIPVILSIFLNNQDVVGFSLNILNIGIYFSCTLTMHILQNGMNTIRDLISQVNKTFKHESFDSIEKISMKSTNRFIKLLTVYWYVAISICAQLMAFYPLYANRGTERVLAVPTWYPFAWKESPTYEIMFVIQCIGQFNLTNIYGMADTFIMSVLLVTGKQLDLLGSNFENCVYYNLMKNGCPRKSVFNFAKTFNAYGQDETTDDFQEKTISIKDINEEERIYEVIKTNNFVNSLQETLRETIKHHQHLLNFIQNFENFIWPLMLVKVTASMSYHTLICFMLVFSTNETFLYTLGQYEVMALYEFLLISYFGQYLINKGDYFRQRIYNCPWYINNTKFQKSFLFVLRGSLRSPRLTIAKLSDLSLGTFLALMKVSTSYFTVLRQTVER